MLPYKKIMTPLKANIIFAEKKNRIITLSIFRSQPVIGRNITEIFQGKGESITSAKGSRVSTSEYQFVVHFRRQTIDLSTPVILPILCKAEGH